MPIDFAPLWSFADPAASEHRFTELIAGLPTGKAHDGDRAEALTQVARAQGLQRRFDDAHATLDAAAAIVGHPQSRALIRLLLERGRLHNSAGDPAGSAIWFQQAWDTARSLNDDALAIDAAHMLGIVEPDERGNAWNQRALALAESSTDPGARRWTASLRNNIAWWLHDHGRAPEALTQFELARDERAQAGARGPLLIARWAVARCLRTLARFDEALAAQRQLQSEWSGPDDADGFVHEEIAECLLALGRAAEAAPHFAQAHALLSGDPHLGTAEPARLARLAELGTPHVR